MKTEVEMVFWVGLEGLGIVVFSLAIPETLVYTSGEEITHLKYGGHDCMFTVVV